MLRTDFSPTSPIFMGTSMWLRPQPQRARMHSHHERVGALHRFPVDVEEHRFAAPNSDFSHAMRIDSGAPIDTACEQRRHTQYVPDKSAMVNSDEIQQAILEIRPWGDLRSEAPLLRVREREHERGRSGRAPVDLDRVVDRPVAKEIAGAGSQIRQQAAMMRAGRDESGDMGVESYARYIEEETVADLAGIDTSDFRAPCPLDRPCRVEWDAQLACEPVTRPSRNDPQCRTGLSGIAELHERTSDFVNRAVPAPCDDEIDARGNRFERQLVRVIATLRQADNPIHA